MKRIIHNLNPNFGVENGERARHGRSEPRPRGSRLRVKCSDVLNLSTLMNGARARRKAAEAAALPIPILEFEFKPVVKAGVGAPEDGRTPKTIGTHSIVQTESYEPTSNRN